MNPIFLIRKDAEDAMIYVRCKLSGYFDITAKTLIRVDSKYWDHDNHSVFSGVKNADAKKVRKNLEGLKTTINSGYTDAKNKLSINKEWLENIITPKNKKIETPLVSDGLVNFFDTYILAVKLSEGTKKKIRVIKGYVERFQQYKIDKRLMIPADKNLYLIKDVDVLFISDFEKYLNTLGYSQNTIAQAVKTIKFICKKANDEFDIEVSNKLETIKPQFTDADDLDKNYLEPNEIKKIASVKLEAEHLDNARDWLLISCETAQRVSDLLTSNSKDISKIKGDWYLTIKQKKTQKVITLYLNPIVKKILNKRDGNFPTPMSDQRYNDHIKEVCRLAGLTNMEKGSVKKCIGKDSKGKNIYRNESGLYQKWQLVTSKIGRKSFVSNNYANMNLTALMIQTGHKSTQTIRNHYKGTSHLEEAKRFAEQYKKAYKKSK
jgi:integrase